MKKSKLSEAKMFELLKEGEAGVSIDDICRRYEISCSTYYKLRSKYGGMDISDLKKLRQLEEENRRLKKLLFWAFFHLIFCFKKSHYFVEI